MKDLPFSQHLAGWTYLSMSWSKCHQMWWMLHTCLLVYSQQWLVGYSKRIVMFHANLWKTKKCWFYQLYVTTHLKVKFAYGVWAGNQVVILFLEIAEHNTSTSLFYLFASFVQYPHCSWVVEYDCALHLLVCQQSLKINPKHTTDFAIWTVMCNVKFAFLNMEMWFTFTNGNLAL